MLLVLGVLAATLPAAAGLAGALVFGWLLILSGLIGLVSYFGARDHAHGVWASLSAIVAVVVGGLIIWRPLAGAITLAILLAAYLAIDAVALVGMGLDQRHRQHRGWVLLVVSGAIDAVLAIAILAMGPLSDVLLLGFLIAIDLVVAGVALLALGFAARRAA